jgi:hypothetical protein
LIAAGKLGKGADLSYLWIRPLNRDQASHPCSINHPTDGARGYSDDADFDGKRKMGYLTSQEPKIIPQGLKPR